MLRGTAKENTDLFPLFPVRRSYSSNGTGGLFLSGSYPDSPHHTASFQATLTFLNLSPQPLYFFYTYVSVQASLFVWNAFLSCLVKSPLYFKVEPELSAVQLNAVQLSCIEYLLMWVMPTWVRSGFAEVH